MNKKLLRKVADWIETHPERYDQNVYFEDRDGGDYGPELGLADVEPKKARKTTCNTVGCVAGWSWVLASDEERELALDDYEADTGRANLFDWESGARKVLRLPSKAATWLFSEYRDEETMPETLRSIAEGATPWETKK